MTVAVDSLIHEYARRYVARDVDGVTELCLCPFLVIREGVAIHLADSAAVHNHFMTNHRRVSRCGLRELLAGHDRHP
jgi:hypothetical protein